MENFHDDVVKSDSDMELCGEIKILIKRMTDEIGFRMTMIFP